MSCVSVSLCAAAAGTLPSDFYFDMDETTLTVGERHACVLADIPDNQQAGKAVCWGDNFFNQTSTPANASFIQLSAGSYYTCGISLSQAIQCWGSVPHAERVPGDGYIQVSAGHAHSCALHKSGQVKCWGGRLGVIVRTPPTDVTFVQVSAGHEMTCGLTTAAQVRCWGRDTLVCAARCHSSGAHARSRIHTPALHMPMPMPGLHACAAWPLLASVGGHVFQRLRARARWRGRDMLGRDHRPFIRLCAAIHRRIHAGVSRRRLRGGHFGA